MITRVGLDHTEFLPPPQRFEAGTQPVSQAIGLAAAVRYLDGVGMDAVHAHERTLERRLRDGLRSIDGVRLLGDAPGARQQAGGAGRSPAEIERVGLAAFDVDGVHAHDVGQFLDSRGIAVRVGHHCAAPLHARFGLTASVRASTALYNTTDEVDVFLDALAQVRPFFGASA
jgi:cysteine desulfurase/selenocysteine lyase